MRFQDEFGVWCEGGMNGKMRPKSLAPHGMQGFFELKRS
jgi:hypothetical protein